MTQRRDGSRFAIEALEVFRTGKVVRQDFYWDDAVPPPIAGTIDLTHAGRPQGDDDFIGTESGTVRQGHGGADYRPCADKIHSEPVSSSQKLRTFSDYRRDWPAHFPQRRFQTVFVANSEYGPESCGWRQTQTDSILSH
jgi:hypothetical protein